MTSGCKDVRNQTKKIIEYNVDKKRNEQNCVTSLHISSQQSWKLQMK